MSTERISNKDLMTVKEVAAYLRMPVASIYYYIKSGKLTAHKVSAKLRISRAKLETEFLKYESPNIADEYMANYRHSLISEIADEVLNRLYDRGLPDRNCAETNSGRS